MGGQRMRQDGLTRRRSSFQDRSDARAAFGHQVPKEGVEPSRPFGALDFESSASANSATSAWMRYIDRTTACPVPASSPWKKGLAPIDTPCHPTKTSRREVPAPFSTGGSGSDSLRKVYSESTRIF